jgi:hypothetical protein
MSLSIPPNDVLIVVGGILAGDGKKGENRKIGADLDDSATTSRDT